MSEGTPESNAKNAKAEAKATKARAKAQRPWYKKKRWILPLGIIALIIVVGVSTSSDNGQVASENNNNDQTTQSNDSGPERVAQGEPAVDGQFTFVVQDLNCGQQTIGEGMMSEDAQGQWCILSTSVENTGNEAQGLSASAQLLYDDQGREFEAALPMAVVDQTPIFEQINPGNSVDGQIYFDVPQEFSPDYVELHDSALSGGIQVNLAD